MNIETEKKKRIERNKCFLFLIFKTHNIVFCNKCRSFAYEKLICLEIVQKKNEQCQSNTFSST